MRRWSGGLNVCVAGLAVFAAACGHRKQKSGDGAPPDAAEVETQPADAAESVAARPLPPQVRPPIRILDATARLVGNGPSACTHQVPPSGDGHRWCAFSVAAAGDAALGELWVMDVTRAAAGDVPACDGTTPSCLRLTSTLALLSAAFFDGDTLIYGTDPVSVPGKDFLGPMHAWRPGWSAGRQISSDRGFTCIGQLHSAAAACLDEPGGDPTKRDSAQVRVGVLLDQWGDALPAIGRWPLRNDNDTAWQAGFSPDGATFVLSSADVIGKKQSLRTWPTDQAGQGAPTLTVDDAEYWTISNDGARIYFLRGLPQRADLLVADFPSGGNVRGLEEGILSYELVGARATDAALSYVKDLDGTKGSYRMLADPGAATAKTIFDFEDILDGARVSLDLRYTVWLDFAFRGVLVRNSDLLTCPLDVPGEPAVFEPVFLEHAGLMFWQEFGRSSVPGRNAFYASPEDCRAKHPLARGVSAIIPVGDQGVLLADERDALTDTSALAYWAVAPAGAGLDPRGPVRIQRGVHGSVAFVGAAPAYLLYEASGPGADETGTFLFGPVPF